MRKSAARRPAKITTAKTRMVTILRSEYDRLKAAAGETKPIPAIPSADAHGRYNAVEFVRATIARQVIERRQRAGLSQQALANLAKVRQETISRIESGRHTATPRVMDKIDRALRKVE